MEGFGFQRETKNAVAFAYASDFEAHATQFVHSRRGAQTDFVELEVQNSGSTSISQRGQDPFSLRWRAAYE
jgi:hypothetical protein